jgi:hypothetical protein
MEVSHGSLGTAGLPRGGSGHDAPAAADAAEPGGTRCRALQEEIYITDNI